MRDENLAAQFIELWDALRANDPLFEAAIEWQTKNIPATLASADLLDDLLSVNDGLLSADIWDWLENSSLGGPEDGLQRKLMLAQAIDRWHSPLSSPNSLPISHLRAARQLHREGQLNPAPSLLRVILRRPLWGRYSDPDLDVPDEGRGPWDTFKNLFVLPPLIEASDPDDKSKTRSVSLAYRRFDNTQLRLPASHESWRPKVGFVPLAQHPGDLTLELSADAEGQWYDARAKDLSDRAAGAVAELCKQGAEIIILPEMVVHPNGVDAIRAAVAKHGPPNQLRLVLAGTWRSPNSAGKPHNEAIILDHRGNEIGRQRKLHRWNLDAPLCDRFDIRTPAPLLPPNVLREFIEPGVEVLVLDTPFGRIAVMICEDLGRSEPGNWLRNHVLLDWLFTPILDSSIEPRRWMADAGGRAALFERCRVVIANSVALTHILNDANKRGGSQFPAVTDCGIGICLDVSGKKASYHIERSEISGSPRDFALVEWAPEAWRDFEPR